MALETLTAFLSAPIHSAATLTGSVLVDTTLEAASRNGALMSSVSCGHAIIEIDRLSTMRLVKGRGDTILSSKLA